jgi:myo-inositol-1(or 4)-monophosphatase
LEVDWLGLCRRSVEGMRELLATFSSTDERAIETGSRGSGGDRTLVIDEGAENVVLGELRALSETGFQFTVFSEERGEIDFGNSAVRVIIDPIDGSLNAKRGLPHHALSIAVAEGETMADVVFGYVYDFGPREEWRAIVGRGAWLNDGLLDPEVRERRTRDGRLEMLGIESANPRWVIASADALQDSARRLRAIGTIAASMCQVAAGRLDAMVTLRNGRGIDSAAAQLIVREAGGHVSYPAYEDRLAAPLDAEPRSPVIAARNLESIAMLERIPT